MKDKRLEARKPKCSGIFLPIHRRGTVPEAAVQVFPHHSINHLHPELKEPPSLGLHGISVVCVPWASPEQTTKCT